MTEHLKKDIGKSHWIGEAYSCGGWRRCTLFCIDRNFSGGSTSWPIAEIDVVDHPGRDGVKPHKEIKIHLRNEIRRSGSGIEVDKNQTELRHVKDIVDRSVLDATVDALKELGIISPPFAVEICMRHVETYYGVGDCWSDD